MDKEFLEKSKWKNKDNEYLFELQKFIDIADNIKDQELKKLIIAQMLKCDKCLTNIAEKIFKDLLNNEKQKTEE